MTVATLPSYFVIMLPDTVFSEVWNLAISYESTSEGMIVKVTQ